MPDKGEQRQGVRVIGVTVVAWIAAAVLVAALVAGIWYFLRGSKEKRSPETPQHVSQAFASPGIAYLPS
jgi:hypothetical protein